jgi:hypothetical protein
MTLPSSVDDRHSILILNIRPYRAFLITPLIEQCQKWQISHELFTNGYNVDEAFSYCAVRAFSDITQVRIANWDHNFGYNDLYKILYSDYLKENFQKSISMAIRGYGFKFYPNETIKAMVTFDEMILVRYFPPR